MAYTKEEVDYILEGNIQAGTIVIAIEDFGISIRKDKIYTVEGTYSDGTFLKFKEIPRRKFRAYRFRRYVLGQDDVISLESSVPVDSSIPDETEGDVIFSKKIVPVKAKWLKEAPAPADPIEDWHDRARIKGRSRNPVYKTTQAFTYNEPVIVPKIDTTGIARAVDALTNDKIMLAGLRGTEVKDD